VGKHHHVPEAEAAAAGSAGGQFFRFFFGSHDVSKKRERRKLSIYGGGNKEIQACLVQNRTKQAGQVGRIAVDLRPEDQAEPATFGWSA